MNKANILRVADAIENGELVKRGIGFNMAFYLAPTEESLVVDKIGGCGTTACIAGWAYALQRPRTKAATFIKRDVEVHVRADATEFLGLTGVEAHKLFVPSDEAGPWRNITPAHAVAVLRHLAETGEVDWSVKPAPTGERS